MKTEDFYKELPLQNNFHEAAKFQAMVPVPKDWWILITDIQGSTQAVADGRYRDVNMAGAACIMAAINACGDVDVPFVFGGDGATLLLPPQVLESCRKAMRASRTSTQNSLNLKLRVGFVPIEEVYKRGAHLEIGKVQMSSNYHQAIFSGDGLTMAEKLVKATDSPYLDSELDESEPNIAGLECRWQSIPARKGEIHSLLVMALGPTVERNSIYAEILEKIFIVYGEDAEQNPIADPELKITLSPLRAYKEAKVLHANANWWDLFQNTFYIFLSNALGVFLFAFKLKFGGTDWGKYKLSIPQSTDFRKFDEVLRMTLSGSARQRKAITSELEVLRSSKKIVYGLHSSSSVQMTCLVMDRQNRHFHFVDGADGGYTLAAKQLKAQVKEL